MTEQSRAGFAAVIGAPNVGKSTLINSMIGQPWLAVSPVPQTTLRSAQMILTLPEGQIVLVDTAGLLPFTGPFYRPVLAAALRSALEADLVVRLIGKHAEDDPFFARLDELLVRRQKRVLRVLTKSDLVRVGEMEPPAAGDQNEANERKWDFRVSGLTGAGVPELLQGMLQHLPEGPPLFPIDDLSTMTMREFVEGWVREALFHCVRDELPHSTFVEVEQYQEREDGSLMLHVALGVERDSQKGILIGSGGQRIKEIGIAARKRIAEQVGAPVHLKLFVKVRHNWRKNAQFIRQYGVDMATAEVDRLCALVGQ